MRNGTLALPDYEMSVTGTEQAILAAVMADGLTTNSNATAATKGTTPA